MNRMLGSFDDCRVRRANRLFPDEDTFDGKAGNNVLPQCKLTQQSIDDAVVARYLWYWSLTPEERAKIDAERENAQ